MLLSPQSDNGSSEFVPTVNPILIREQLRRLLAHPLFTNSKRYPVLLAYTVEQALSGHTSDLKERMIGVEAFGRQPNYDVGLDPVVRTTAAEVRKRLIQYYYDPNHAGELIIELPLGAYIPQFRMPEFARRETAPELPSSSGAEAAAAPAAERSGADRAGTGHSAAHFPWIATAIALLFGAALGFTAGKIKLPASPTNMERFWAPITASSSRVTYCLGEPNAAVDQKHEIEDRPVEYANLNVSDVTTLARSLVPIVPRNNSFQVIGSAHAAFDQLRQGPIVLIGAFDNAWTMRITHDLPIRFEYGSDFRKIVDRKHNPALVWTLSGDPPDAKLTEDYGVVARIHDQVTGQPVIIIAGIWGEGTEAASELASDPRLLDALLKQVPASWERMNLEAVIETQLIDGHPGPPRVLAVETW